MKYTDKKTLTCQNNWRKNPTMIVFNCNKLVGRFQPRGNKREKGYVVYTKTVFIILLKV